MLISTAPSSVSEAQQNFSANMGLASPRRCQSLTVTVSYLSYHNQSLHSFYCSLPRYSTTIVTLYSLQLHKMCFLSNRKSISCVQLQCRMLELLRVSDMKPLLQASVSLGEQVTTTFMEQNTTSMPVKDNLITIKSTMVLVVHVSVS